MEEKSLVKSVDQAVSETTISLLLNQIRPIWKGKGLIKRVERLLPVDPSSACQRLLNAAITDLREKIVNIGLDIAKEVAKNYKLPPIEKEEDILENYSTYNIIDLSYRIGILNRPEWRRVQRCYEIRRDLEHEDNEYEAVLEDSFYIFKSTIEVVLSQDPIETLKVTDIKQLISEPQRITVTEGFLTDYKHAPELRQHEILQFLISIIKDENQPDLIKENAFEILRHFKSVTKTSVAISIAQDIEKSLGRNILDYLSAELSFAIGATPYFKSNKINDLYDNILIQFKKSTSDWELQADVVRQFHDIGHFNHCPQNKINDFLKYLIQWYIGAPGGYGDFGSNRAVFYSNGAAPIIAQIVKFTEVNLYEKIEKLSENREISFHLGNKHILRRFENLLDLSSRNL